MKSLKTRIIAYFFLTIFVTVLAIGVIVSIYNTGVSKHSYKDLARQQLNLVDYSIKIFYEELDKDLTHFANKSLLKQADHTITSYKNKTNVNMTPASNGGIEQDIYEDFASYADAHEGTLYIYMGTEDEGYIQWPETSIYDNYTPIVRNWYLKAIEADGKVIRSDPYPDSFTGNLIVSNAIVLYNDEGEIYGSVAMDKSPESIMEVLHNTVIGKNGHVVLIHKSGMVLADAKNSDNNTRMIDILGIDGIEEMLSTDLDYEANIPVSFITPPAENAEKVPDEAYAPSAASKKYYVRTMQSSIEDFYLLALVPMDEINAPAKNMALVVIIVGIIVLILGVIASFILAATISKPIVVVSNMLNKLAGKDFSEKIQDKSILRKDEIGVLSSSANTLVDEISTIISKTQHSTNIVSDSADELITIVNDNTKAIEETAKAIDSLATRSSEQAMDADTITSILSVFEKDLDRMTDEIESTRELADHTKETTVVAVEEMKKLDKVKVESIEKTKNISDVITRINANAGEAENFTTTIESISSQTNLLALNASIEAARAGDAGKGFAVVAEEIRKLSVETNEATVLINDLIQGIKKESNAAVNEMEIINTLFTNLSDAISNSENRFQGTNEALNKLLEIINALHINSSGLKDSKEDMISKINLIMASIEDMSAVSEEVSAATEEEAASMIQSSDYVKQLAEVTTALKEGIKTFKINE